MGTLPCMHHAPSYIMMLADCQRKTGSAVILNCDMLSVGSRIGGGPRGGALRNNNFLMATRCCVVVVVVDVSIHSYVVSKKKAAFKNVVHHPWPEASCHT